MATVITLTNPICTLVDPSNAVLLDISTDFSTTTLLASAVDGSGWMLEGSPNSTITIHDTLFDRAQKGALVKITSAFKCFRSADVNKYIRFPKADDSGEYASFRVVTYKNAKRITARLKHKMSKEDYPIVNGETVADKIEDRKKKPDVESGMWSLESKSWTDALGWPTHGCFHQGRMWLVRNYDVWASISNDFENFTIGDAADMGIHRELGGQEVDIAQWIVSRGDLFIGTNGGEWRCFPSESGVITPENLNIELQTSIGGYKCKPVITPHGIVFVQKHGATIRELAYNVLANSTEGYSSENLSILAEHLFENNIKRIVYR